MIELLIDLSIIINASAIVQSFILIANLIRRKYLRKYQNRLLALLLFAFSIIIGNSILIFGGYSDLIPFYEKFSNTCILLIAPSLYLYIGLTTQRIVSNKLKNVLHFLPFLAYLAVVLVESTTGLLNEDEATAIGLVFFIIQNATYISLSFSLLKKHAISIRNLYSDIQDVSLNWIRQILVMYTITLLIATSFIIYQVTVAELPPLINLNIVLIYSILIITLSYRSMSRSDVLFKTEPYAEKGLASDRIKEYNEKLLAYIKEEEPFVNSKLTLQDLSDSLNISSSYLSQTINKSTGSNFFDFINGFRIEKVKDLIADESHRHLTLLAVAETCGFRSGSAFNTAFKKHTGMKPSEYRKMVLAGK